MFLSSRVAVDEQPPSDDTFDAPLRRPVYSKDGDLSVEQLEAYRSPEFSDRSIPSLPPPAQQC